MFGHRPRKKENLVREKLNALGLSAEKGELSLSLEANHQLINHLFENDDTLIIRQFENAADSGLHFFIAYSNGVVDQTILNENVIKPLMANTIPKAEGDLCGVIASRVLLLGQVTRTGDTARIIDSIAYGDTALFIDGYAEALLLGTKGFDLRAITEPDSEKILSGPKEGFNESLITSLSLIRRKLRTNRLKMKFRTFGRQSNSTAAICYLEGIVDQNLLEELNRRLDRIDIDAVLDTNYFTELIRDNPHSPFRTIGYTERPDVVVGKLLEGRIAVFLDGTPVVITLPYLFIENFQSSEDYFLSPFYTSFERVLRMIGFFLTIGIPGFYIAVVAFHHEMLPTQLLINIAIDRQSVPLPAALEAFVMLIMFDILRETGVRMPSNIGQALSIVGALVIGQAAVDAKLVAAPMIIVVGTTGITNLLVPKMNAPVIYSRLLLLILSSSLGLFGFMMGTSLLLIHILNLKSLGIYQLQQPRRFQEAKDSLIRAPIPNQKTRPPTLTDNTIKLNLKKDSADE